MESFKAKAPMSLYLIRKLDGILYSKHQRPHAIFNSDDATSTVEPVYNGHCICQVNLLYNNQGCRYQNGI